MSNWLDTWEKSVINLGFGRRTTDADDNGAIDVDVDPLTQQLQEIENLNKASCDYLDALGFDASQFRMKAPRAVASVTAVTVPYSEERYQAIKLMEDDKEHRTEANARIETALAILNEMQGKEMKDHTNKQLGVLIRWKHQGKLPNGRKQELIAAWSACKDSDDPTPDPWSEDEEVTLHRIKTETVTMKDTALARQAEADIKQLGSAIQKKI